MPSWLAKGSPVRELAKRVVEESAVVLGTITRVRTEEPAVALTFDDGPHPEATPAILELLARHDAKATFFMVGKAARRHPELARRVVAEGHAVGNHSWDHTSFPLLTGRGRRLQIRWGQEALPEGAVKLLRPPWGHQNLPSRLDAAALGYRVVAWSVMAEDWAPAAPGTLVAQVEERLRPGAIVLMHDALFHTDAEAHRDRGPTIEAVAMLLERHAGRYRFVTVPELLALGRPVRWHWYKKSDLDWLSRQI